jgi:hypothetical protein
MYLILSSLKKKYSTMLLLGLGFVALSGSSYGQRVYADAEQHSAKETLLDLGFVTLSEVADAANSTDTSNLSDYSNLQVNVGLNLLTNIIGGPAYQNLQFTGVNKPAPTSPLTFKFEGNTSLASLLNGFNFQLTNNTITTGAANLNPSFLSLLTILATNTPTEYTFTNPNTPYDGIVLTSSLPSGVALSAFVSAKYYYAFFIATPKIDDTTITGCADSLTLTLQNTSTTGIWYKIYTDTTEAAIDSFAHTYTLNNAKLPSAGNDTTYYIISEDLNTGGQVYYSAWKAWTVTRSALPVAPVVNGDTICSGETPVLGISPYSASFSYHAFDELTGGSLLGTNTTSSITLPVITTSTTEDKTYYVSATETATGCTSATRTAVTVTINQLPPPPDITIN